MTLPHVDLTEQLPLPPKEKQNKKKTQKTQMKLMKLFALLCMFTQDCILGSKP